MKTNLFKWVLGVLGVVVIYDLLFEDDVFTHIRKNEINYTGNYPDYFFGVTRLTVDFKVEPVLNMDGFYKPKIIFFKITSQRTINSNPVFQHIMQFQPYYHPNGKYDISDYRSDFNTKEGTEYHEGLHQDEIIEVIKHYRPIIMNKMKEIFSRNKIEVEYRANKYLNEMKLFMESDDLPNTEESKSRHEGIKLKEWEWYHEKYKEWLAKNGK